MKYPSGKNRIGYSLSAAGSRFFVGIDPTSETEIPNQFVQATETEVEEACFLANQAFEEYRNISIEKRLAFIQSIVEEIQLEKEPLIDLMMLETGLPKARAITELNRSVFQFREYSEGLRNLSVLEIKTDPPNPQKQGMRNFDFQKMNIPLGPVVVFGSSNFPFAYSALGGDVASALVAGCSVVVKSHPMHPNTSALSADCILKAAEKTGMPNGIFSHLNAHTYAVGEALVTNPLIQAVGFTGSIAGGKALLKLSNSREIPIPVYAEMGSVNPVVVCADLTEEQVIEIADKLCDSVSGGAGQFCTSPGIIFLEGMNYRFVDRLMEKLKSVDPQCMLGKSIRENYTGRKEEIGAQFPLLLDGAVSGNFIRPSAVLVSLSDFVSNKVLHEEVFGAFVCIVQCNNLEEIQQGIAVLDGQLTGSVFTNSFESFSILQNSLSRKVGRLIVNGVPTGVEVSVAQQHGGPFPSSSSSLTAVGQDAVKRFLRPITFQNVPVEWRNNLLRK